MDLFISFNSPLYIFGFWFHPVNLASNIFIPFSFKSYDNCAAFNLIFVSVVIPHPVAEPLNTQIGFFLEKSNSKLISFLYLFSHSSGYIFLDILNISSSVGHNKSW